MNRKLAVLMTVALAATTLLAATGRKKGALASTGNDDGPTTTGRASKFLIEQPPRLGSQALAMSPSIQGAQQVYKKPRQWIVINLQYATFGTDTSKFLDQLTFTWHVLLDAKQAKENKGNREGNADYSYFTTAVSYFNIPAGSHCASVVLPPSYYERYGEAKAVGVEITNENGDILGGDCWSEIKGIDGGKKFWEDQNIMSATSKKTGKPMIERRQGLVDRSKTIWALVFPNDYEATIQ